MSLGSEGLWIDFLDFCFVLNSKSGEMSRVISWYQVSRRSVHILVSVAFGFNDF